MEEDYRVQEDRGEEVEDLGEEGSRGRSHFWGMGGGTRVVKGLEEGGVLLWDEGKVRCDEDLLIWRNV